MKHSEVPGPTSVTGGDGEEATPVPISNTEVKLFSVDGTAWETVWESRTPPVLFLKALILINNRQGQGFFCAPSFFMDNFCPRCKAQDAKLKVPLPSSTVL